MKRIYKNNIVSLLKELSDIEFQKNIWLNVNNPRGLVCSFVEAVNMLFDDCVVTEYLNEGEIIISKSVTKALKELSLALDSVNEYRPEEEIINDPLMDIVRVKAAECLVLIEASDGSESTVDIIES